MALVTGSFTSYNAVANREDLSDAIYNISPTDTPFMSAIGRGKADNVLHEWQTDSLASAVTTNAVLEGDEVTRATSAPTTRVQNYCQISRKDVTVSGTQRAINHAGIKDMLSYQFAKKSKELKRDMESILLTNQGQAAGDATTARKLRSMNSWLTSNTSRATNGANATAATAAATDSTNALRTFTETILKTVIQNCFINGGEPSLLMVGPVNKQRVSDFTGRTQARQNIDKERIQGAASLYASDFGDLKVVPNRFQRERDAWLVDPEMAAVAYLRPFKTFELSKVGDADSRVILAEYTLQMKNQAAHGLAADLTTT